MEWFAVACDATVRWGLVALLAFTPLAFGSVEAWAMSIMEWGVVTLILVEWAGHAARGGGGRLRAIVRSRLFLPLVLFLGLCIMQTVPLPPSWLEVLSPGSARAYASAGRETLRNDAVAADRFDAMAAQIGVEKMPDRRPISVNPEATAARVQLLAVFLGLFFLVAAWADRRERILFLLATLTAVGFAVALFGLVQYLTWNGRIYWVRRVPKATAFGPFVNHNHFAGYVEMIIPIALSMVFFLYDAGRRAGLPLDDDRGEEPVSAAVVESRDSYASRWSQSALAFFAAVILIASLFLSQSRGGILSALTSALFLFLLVWRRITSRILAWSSAIVLPLLTLLFAVWLGSDLIRQYGSATQIVEHEASLHSRWLVWVQTATNLRLAGWTGFGLGSYEDSFAAFAPAGSTGRWDRAHNDYLQMAWETGVLGVLFILWGAFAYGRRYLWPALRAKAHPLDLFRLGIAVSIVSLALHSIVDFNLQIPSNGFLFALLMGLLTSLHALVERGEPEPVWEDEHDPEFDAEAESLSLP